MRLPPGTVSLYFQEPDDVVMDSTDLSLDPSFCTGKISARSTSLGPKGSLMDCTRDENFSDFSKPVSFLGSYASRYSDPPPECAATIRLTKFRTGSRIRVHFFGSGSSCFAQCGSGFSFTKRWCDFYTLLKLKNYILLWLIWYPSVLTLFFFVFFIFICKKNVLYNNC